MMLPELIGFGRWGLALAFIGFGPALWLISPMNKRLSYSMALAPGIGFALLGILSFPLSRYVGPVQSWAGWVTTGLILISAALIVIDWRRNRSDYRFINRASVGWGVGSMAVCGLILVSPLIFEGIQYTIYRGNSHDAAVYVSLAETLRVTDWKTLMSGVEFSYSNLDGLRQLASISPTALYSARFVGYPFFLNNMATLAWGALVAGVPVYRFYYVYHISSFMLVFGEALVLSDLLKLAAPYKYLTALAVAVGFWARFVLERDAGYQISGTAVFSLLVCAWMLLEREPSRRFSRAHILFAIASAALIVVCLPIVLIAFLAMLFYYALGLVQRTKHWTELVHPGGAGLLGILLLGLTGQIDFIIRGALYVFSITDDIKAIMPEGLKLIQADGLAALWGMPSSILLRFRPVIVSWPIEQIFTLMGMVLTTAFIIGLFLMLRRSAPTAERIIVSIAVSSLLLSAVFLLSRNYRGIDKVFTYIYLYLILGLAVFVHYTDLFLKPLSGKLVSASLGIWMIAQCFIGFYLPTHPQITYIGDPNQAEQYDFSPIETYLDSNAPRLLLVNIPRNTNWVFAYYSMFAFSRYPAYFQSGLIVDNNTTYQNLWLQPPLTRVPDYAIVLKSADYIKTENLGTKVAETADLALYRITTYDLSAFTAREEQLRLQEALKPEFPSLQNDATP